MQDEPEPDDADQVKLSRGLAVIEATYRAIWDDWFQGVLARDICPINMHVAAGEPAVPWIGHT